MHIPLSDLPGRAAEVPAGRVWVYRRSGYRSMIAASLLAAADRQVISIKDDFTSADGAGLTLTRRHGQAKEIPR